MAKQVISRTHRGTHPSLNPAVALLLGASILPTCAFGATGNVDVYGSFNISPVNEYVFTLVDSGVTGAQAGLGLANLALFGAHHRSLLDMGLTPGEEKTCAWATADAAKHESADFSKGLVEAGVCRDIGGARWGVGVGQAWSHQDRLLGGKTTFDGQYLIAEVANDFRNGVQTSLIGYYGRFDAKMRRNYTNGPSVDSSIGTPDATSTALRARLDWKDVAKLGTFSVSPYAAYTWTETRLDGYTETGGGLPLQFADATWRTNSVRIGAAANTTLTASTDLRMSLEAVHRFESSTGGVSGPAFSLPAIVKEDTWGYATLDVDHRLTQATALSFGANVASDGDDSAWGVTAGVRTAF